MKKIFLAAVALVMMSGNMVAAEKDEDLPQISVEEIFSGKSGLAELVTPLYEYVQSKSFDSDDLDKRLDWMVGYRAKMAEYYDRNKLGTDTAAYDKANYVVEIAVKICKKSKDRCWLTLEGSDDLQLQRVINSVLVFEHYNAFAKVLDASEKQDYYSENEEVSQYVMLAKTEHEAWNELSRRFLDVYSRCEYMSYCIFAMINFKDEAMRESTLVDAENKILKAHTVMYQKEMGDWDSAGIYDELAIKLFNDCVNMSVTANVDWAVASGRLVDEDNAEYLNKTKNLAAKLPELVQRWIHAREEWFVNYEDMGSAHDAYYPNTSEVLVKMATVISNL